MPDDRKNAYIVGFFWLGVAVLLTLTGILLPLAIPAYLMAAYNFGRAKTK
jgi:hypothetical protein